MEARSVRAHRLAISTAVAAAIVMTAAAATAQPLDLSAGPPWAAALRRVDDALAAGRHAAAVGALDEAYRAALGSRRWHGMVEVGDVARRIGQAAGTPRAYDARARQAYLVALFRARQERSVEGVQRVTEAFASLGDHDVARRCERVVRDLRTRPGDSRAGTREPRGGFGGRTDSRTSGF